MEEVEDPIRALGPVDRLCEQHVHDVTVLDPVLATHLGIASDQAALTDLAPDGWQAREERSRRTQAAVQAAVPSRPARGAGVDRVP